MWEAEEREIERENEIKKNKCKYEIKLQTGKSKYISSKIVFILFARINLKFKDIAKRLLVTIVELYDWKQNCKETGNLLNEISMTCRFC